MIADESLVTLNGLKKYDQKKGKAVIEANELPASPLNKVYNVGDDVYSKDVKLSTYQQMMDEVSKVKVDGNTQDANRNIISKAVIEQANIPPAPLDKVYNIGGSPIELTASGTCTHETSPGGTEPLTIENLKATGSGILPAAGTYTLTYTEDTDWTSKEITYRGLTFTAVKRYKIDDGLFEKAAFADSVTIDGTVHSNVINGEVFTGTGWVIIWNIWDEADNAYDGSIYLKDANATIPTVVSTVVSGLNGWQGSFSSIPEGTTEVTFNNDYTVGTALHPFPYGEHALCGAIDTRLKVFMVTGYNLPSPTAAIVTPGSGLYMGDCFINHLPARSSFKLKSSIDNVWHTVSYPLPENGTFIYGTSLSEESCMVIRVNNQLRVITIDDTQDQAFTINYEEETSTRVFSKSIELITKDSAGDLFTPKYSEDIIEKSAFTHIQSAANATQHDVNVAIDSKIEEMQQYDDSSYVEIQGLTPASQVDNVSLLAKRKGNVVSLKSYFEINLTGSTHLATALLPANSLPAKYRPGINSPITCLGYRNSETTYMIGRFIVDVDGSVSLGEYYTSGNDQAVTVFNFVMTYVV